VLDLVSGTFAAVSTVVNNVVDAVFNSTEGFDSLGKVITNLITLSLTPLKVLFYGIKLGVQEAQLAWEKSFFGDKDQKTISELNKGIEETKDNLKEVTIAAIESAKGIATNFGDAITEISSAVKAGAKAVEETDIKAAIAQGKRLVALKKNAEVAAALNTGLIEQYDSQAEKLRQIRDDEALSIEDRKTANDELGLVLEEQFKLMQKNGDVVLENAQAQFKANKSQENNIALIDAQNEKLAISAQIEGFRSEQIINNIALRKEEVELGVTATDAENERKIAQLNFDAEREENETKRIEKLREVLEIENQLAIDKLARDKELYKEGTQFRIDSEQEYFNTVQDLRNRETELNKSSSETDKKTAKGVNGAKLAFASNTFSAVTSLFEEESKIGKALAIGQATISGIEGVQNAYTTAQASPLTLLNPAYPAIQAGLAGIFSSIQIAKIASTSANGGGGASSVSSTPSAPSFPIVQGTGSNQIAEAINSNNQQPIEAFVVSANMTTSQELDRNIINEGSV
jgi:hypothetical protein